MKTRDEILRYSYLSKNIEPKDLWGLWRLWIDVDDYIATDTNMLLLYHTGDGCIAHLLNGKVQFVSPLKWSLNDQWLKWQRLDSDHECKVWLAMVSDLWFETTNLHTYKPFHLLTSIEASTTLSTLSGSEGKKSMPVRTSTLSTLTTHWRGGWEELSLRKRKPMASAPGA